LVSQLAYGRVAADLVLKVILLVDSRLHAEVSLLSIPSDRVSPLKGGLHVGILHAIIYLEGGVGLLVWLDGTELILPAHLVVRDRLVVRLHCRKVVQTELHSSLLALVLQGRRLVVGAVGLVTVHRHEALLGEPRIPFR